MGLVVNALRRPEGVVVVDGSSDTGVHLDETGVTRLHVIRYR
ncbi:hypothetical protein [Streptomyces sp. NPDC003374]